MASQALIDLQARRATICAELATLTANNGQAGSRPNTGSTDGGTSVDHVGYKDGLYRELKEIDALIRSMLDTDNLIADNDPFEIVTRVVS